MIHFVPKDHVYVSSTSLDSSHTGGGYGSTNTNINIQLTPNLASTSHLDDLSQAIHGYQQGSRINSYNISNQFDNGDAFINFLEKLEGSIYVQPVSHNVVNLYFTTYETYLRVQQFKRFHDFEYQTHMREEIVEFLDDYSIPYRITSDTKLRIPDDEAAVNFKLKFSQYVREI